MSLVTTQPLKAPKKQFLANLAFLFHCGYYPAPGTFNYFTDQSIFIPEHLLTMISLFYCKPPDYNMATILSQNSQ